MPSNTQCYPNFQSSCLTDAELSALICPDLSMKLPDTVWDLVWIDGGECKGCFTTEITEETNDAVTNGTYYDIQCYLDVPKCGCRCRVICGSEISFDGRTMWEIIGEQPTQHTDCTRWEIRKADCNEC